MLWADLQSWMQAMRWQPDENIMCPRLKLIAEALLALRSTSNHPDSSRNQRASVLCPSKSRPCWCVVGSWWGLFGRLYPDSWGTDSFLQRDPFSDKQSDQIDGPCQAVWQSLRYLYKLSQPAACTWFCATGITDLPIEDIAMSASNSGECSAASTFCIDA